MADQTQEVDGIIEKALAQLAETQANGQPPKIRINRNDLPPEMYKQVIDRLRPYLTPDLPSKISNMVTGRLNRMPSYGEYNSNDAGDVTKWSQMAKFGPQNGESLTPEQMKAASAYNSFNSAADDAGKMDLLKLFDPEAAASADIDPFGNTFVVKGGKKLYLNKPGVSLQDAKELGTQTVGTPEAVAGLGATVASSGSSLLARMLAGGAYGAVGSLGMDRNAMTGGSQQGVSIPRAAANALGGLGGELAAPIANKLVGSLYKVLKNDRYFSPNGAFRPEGYQVLMRSGIDWKNLSAETKATIRSMVNKAQSPEDLFKFMAGNDLPGGPVRLTKGQSEADTGQYMDEDLLRSGAMGDKAASSMKLFDQNQAGDIRKNVNSIADTINPGGMRQNTWGQGGSSVTRALQEQKLAAKGTVDKAFDAARSAGDTSYYPSVDEVKVKILNDPEISPQLNPLMYKHNQILRDAWEDFQDTFGTAEGAAKTDNSVTVKSSFDYLKRLNALINDNPTNFGLRQLKRKVQKGLADDALVKTVVGEPGSVEKFLSANKLFREYAGTYRAGDLVESLTEMTPDPKTGKQVFAVDPSDGSKMILGANKLGLLNKTGTKETLTRLKSLLPSERWNELREETFIRALGWGEKDFADDAGLVKTAAQFKSAINKLRTESPEVYTTLFSDKERAVFDKFGDVYQKATMAPPTKSTVGSRTTPLLFRGAQAILPNLGPKMKGLLSVVAKPLLVNTYKEASGAAKAAAATGSGKGAASVAMKIAPMLPGVAAAPLGIGAAKTIEGLLDRYGLYNN